MKTLINRNKETTPFDSVFIQLAMNQSSKLPFTTKEEYLTWVKQWKADFKIVSQAYTRQKYEWGRDACQLPEKIARKRAKVNKIAPLTEAENARIGVLNGEFLAAYGLPSYYTCLLYLLWHMLVLRKAGKLKSHAQYVMRKQEEMAVA